MVWAFSITQVLWGECSAWEGWGDRLAVFWGTHRATPLRVGEVHVGDEQHRLRLQVALRPQERDLIPSEAREQTAFQTYRWRVQFISAPTAPGEGSPFPRLPAGMLGTGQEPAAPPGQPKGAQNDSQGLVGVHKGLWDTGKEPSEGLTARLLLRGAEGSRLGSSQTHGS